MFAICRVKKIKRYSLKAVGDHNERKLEAHNFDTEKVKDNIRWTKFKDDSMSLSQLCKKQLKDAGITSHRKDAAVAVEVVLTASPEYFRPKDPSEYGAYEKDRFEAWRKRSEAFLHAKYGENLIEITIHLDEATPHMHGIVTPITMKTKNKRRTKDDIANNVKAKTYTEATLDAKTIFNKFALIKLQDEYAASVKDIHLMRGIAGSKAVHSELKEQYKADKSDDIKKYVHSEILDQSIICDADIPIIGKAAALEKLYKTVVKSVENNVLDIINRLTNQVNRLKRDLKAEKSRTKAIAKEYGSTQKVFDHIEDLNQKIKDVLHDKDKIKAEKAEVDYLLLTTQKDAQRSVLKLQSELDAARASLSKYEPTQSDTESLSNRIINKQGRGSVFNKNSRNIDDNDPKP